MVQGLLPREASEMLVNKARQRARGGGDNRPGLDAHRTAVATPHAGWPARRCLIFNVWARWPPSGRAGADPDLPVSARRAFVVRHARAARPLCQALLRSMARFAAALPHRLPLCRHGALLRALGRLRRGRAGSLCRGVARA